MLSKEVSLLKDYLTEKGYDLHLESKEETDFVEIKWKNNGDEHYVYSVDIVYHKGRLAWFQASKNHHYRLCVVDRDNLWEWEPVLYNPFFGCLSMALRWIEEQLMFVYRDKHDIYIAAVQDGKVKYHKFHGEKFKLTENHFTYQTYSQSGKDLVSMLEIPSLKQLGSIELRAARQLGLEPENFH